MLWGYCFLSPIAARLSIVPMLSISRLFPAVARLAACISSFASDCAGWSTAMGLSLEGELFVYSSKTSLAAFRHTGSLQPLQTIKSSSGSVGLLRKHVVYIPGLTDGLLTVHYIPALAAAVNRLGYSFVQPILSSSYTGFGTSSLHQDVKELDDLLDHLFSESPSPLPLDGKATEIQDVRDEVVLIGHSTGCQDSVFYMKHGRPDLRQRVMGVVLQAPVSDREWLESLPETEALVEEAKKRLGGDELMPKGAAEAPITATRFLSLTTKDGDDDMFSSDLSVEERQSRLGHMAFVPTAAFLSGADEYVSPGGGRSPEKLADWFRAALSDPGPAEGAVATINGEGEGAMKKTAVTRKPLVRVIEGGNHALQEKIHKQMFISGVEEFLAGLKDVHVG